MSLIYGSHYITLCIVHGLVTFIIMTLIFNIITRYLAVFVIVHFNEQFLYNLFWRH